MSDCRTTDPSASITTPTDGTMEFGGLPRNSGSPGNQDASHGEMSGSQIREKFLRDHRSLRGKAAVVATLALDVLRGDEELASALRLKGEELHTFLADHMQWEERLLLPLLVESSHGTWSGAEVIEEHEDQRLRLHDSLSLLRSANTSHSTLARDLLELVRCLEADMSSEERRVIRAMMGSRVSE